MFIEDFSPNNLYEVIEDESPHMASNDRFEIIK